MNTRDQVKVATILIAFTAILVGCASDSSPDNSVEPQAGSTCEAVPEGTPGFTVPAGAAGAPGVWLPAVEGWEQSAQPQIDLMLGNRSLASHDLTSTAFILINDVPEPDMTPQQLLDDFVRGIQDRHLETGAQVAGFASQHTAVCGLDASRVAYTLGTAEGTVANTTNVVAVPADTTTHLVALIVQSPIPDNPQFQRDLKTFLDRWIVFTPGATNAIQK